MLKLQRKVQQGFTIIELLIVIAIIGILATLVLTNFQGAQAKGRDTVRKSDINSIYQKLEEYYNENGGYPDAALNTTVLAGIDAEALNDAEGAAIVISIENAATPTALNPGNTNEYAYTAYGTGCGVAPTGYSCTNYIISTFLERETPDQYDKVSLN